MSVALEREYFQVDLRWCSIISATRQRCGCGLRRMIVHEGTFAARLGGWARADNTTQPQSCEDVRHLLDVLHNARVCTTQQPLILILHFRHT